MWQKRQYRLRHLNTGRLLSVLKKPFFAKGGDQNEYYLALIKIPKFEGIN